MARQKRNPHTIGLISDDPIQLAQRVHDQLAYGDRIVWACERGRVHAAEPEAAGTLSAHSIAGTFRLGESFDALVEDLKCLRDALMKDWILDEGAAPAQRFPAAPRKQSQLRWS